MSDKILKCPRCAEVLCSIEFEGQRVEVCPDCKGEWLDAGELEKIVEHHDEVFTSGEIASLDAVNKEIFTAERDNHDELNCPHCKNVQMEHFNYADTSGIILHKCLQCGGIWADKDELQKVEEIVDGWKEDLGRDTLKFGSILDKIELQEQKELDKAVSISGFGFVNAVLRRFCE